MDTHSEQPGGCKPWIVAHLGAYLHYIAARALYKQGMLERFFTDFCAAKGLAAGLRALPQTVQPGVIKRLAGRVPQGIPPSMVSHFPWLGITNGLKARLGRRDSRLERYLNSGQRFGNAVAKRSWAGAAGIFCLSSQALEMFTAAKSRRIVTALDVRIAPLEIEAELLAPEYERFASFEEPKPRDGFFAAFCERERAEFDLADIILCPSDFVHAAVLRLGVPASRCQVVNYAYEKPPAPPVTPKVREALLRVLTVGTVGLRKGSHYVLEAARRLKGLARFRMLGSIGATPEAQGDLRRHLELLGPVPRSEVGRHFEWADVFLLPSLCEGSATVTYEALAHGLPVVCTTNTGSVVRDGVEGFIAPIRDVDAIVAGIERLAGDPTLLAEMSCNARQRAQDFTLEAYSHRLLSALRCSTR